MQLNDPAHQESANTAGDCRVVPGDRFTSSPLSHTQIGILREALAHDQRRRCLYRPGHLRAFIDGEEWRWCNAGEGLSEPFKVPLTTPYLEIYGDDADGALLLAVFPLPEPASIGDGRAQYLWATLEGGQAIGMEISLGIETSGVASEYVIQMAYSEPAEASMRGDENPSEAISAAPRPKTSALLRPWISASRGAKNFSILIACACVGIQEWSSMIG